MAECPVLPIQKKVAQTQSFLTHDLAKEDSSSRLISSPEKLGVSLVTGESDTTSKGYLSGVPLQMSSQENSLRDTDMGRKDQIKKRDAAMARVWSRKPLCPYEPETIFPHPKDTGVSKGKTRL